MADKFKANIYGVEKGSVIDGEERFANLRATMAHIWAQPPQERVFPIGGLAYRLEHFRETPGLCLLNFVLLQFSGPGRAALGRPVTDFNLNSDDRFAYQTAMLYDYHHELAFIQAGRPGMTAKAISDYLTSYVWESGLYFQFNPALDQNARDRALQNFVIRAVEMRVAIRDFTQEDRDLGLSLNQVMDWGGDYGARHIDIKMSIGRGKGSLATAKVRELARRALEALEPKHELETLKFSGRDSVDENTKVIDLLQHKEHRELELQVDPRYRTIPHEVRWRALESIRHDYLAST